MQVTKGLWSALGAGTSLALAGVVVLFAVSVLLAVDGWPQAGGGGPGEVALRAAPPPTAAPAATAPVVLRAPVVRRVRGARRRAGSPAPPRRHGAPSPAPRPVPVQGASPGAPLQPSPAPATPGPSVTIPEPNVPAAVNDTVHTVTGVVDDVVRPISPQAADTVDQIVHKADGLVGSLPGVSAP
jgi:hypothetical protein